MTLVSGIENNTTLSINKLHVGFETDGGLIHVVDGVSLAVPAGKTVALVGESGCGKSVTALSILRLLPQPPARIASGSIRFQDNDGGEPVDLLRLDEAALRHIRGGRIGMVFQEPMTALNPVMTVGRQIVEAIRVHRSVPAAAAKREAVAALDRVGIREPQRRFAAYPHELSGGMRQRALLAMALINDPVLLIADEPTTALDTTIQMHLLQLLKELQDQTGMSVLLITHDLGVVAEVADYAYVMYAGRIVEQAPVAELFARPLHPYTQGLMRCTPRLDSVGRRLEVIPGTVPDFARPPTGCRFHPRCQLTRDRAEQEPTEAVWIDQDGARVHRQCVGRGDGRHLPTPTLKPHGPDHLAACCLIESSTVAVTPLQGFPDSPPSPQGDALG